MRASLGGRNRGIRAARGNGDGGHDVFLEATGVPTTLVAPSSLDISGIGKLTGPPWGRDQKFAALAGWTVLEAKSRRR